ncbi:hypothetical protein WJX84_010152 [Apatococcus fuscideae]|uniref:Cyclin-like domain-containing protein n=1 Tax=Apatococcus fuscideae TaxID=2026836 RepID=A0AAW1RYC7_9CHLO
MVFCKECKRDVEIWDDGSGGFSCCPNCGTVLDEDAFSSEVGFTKDAGGDSAVVGSFVSDTGVARGVSRISGGKVYSSEPGDSRERALAKGKDEIRGLVDSLKIEHKQDTIDSSLRFYQLALQHAFTRGRRVNQVAAVCTYIYCRQASKPFMLIDFSDALSINMFELGSVFLSLLLLLRLEQHPVFARPVDPSLYLHRYAGRLNLGRKTNTVSDTAVQLVKSMKRDWLQTGRRPAGICGASLYIACQVHGFDRTKREIISVVHVGEATLSKRVHEFTHTASGQLTADEFAKHVKQVDGQTTKELQAMEPSKNEESFGEGECCDHVASGTTNFAKGMCQGCYLEYLETCGGHLHGAHPPAYKRALKKADEEWQRRVDEEANEAALDDDTPLGLPAPGDEHDPMADAMDAAMAAEELGGFRALMPEGTVEHGLRHHGDGTLAPPPDPGSNADEPSFPASACSGAGPQEAAQDGNQEASAAAGNDEAQAGAGEATTGEEPGERKQGVDTYSDVSDTEVDAMILSEAESKSRAKVWEFNNADWLEKVAVKDAAQAARDAIQAGQAAGGEEGTPKGKKRGRKPGGKNAGPELRDGKGPPESASEAASRMLAQKKLSSKLNHEVLQNMFDEKLQDIGGQEDGKGKRSKVGQLLLSGSSDRRRRKPGVRNGRQKRLRLMQPGMTEPRCRPLRPSWAP